MDFSHNDDRSPSVRCRFPTAEALGLSSPSFRAGEDDRGMNAASILKVLEFFVKVLILGVLNALRMR